MTELTEEPENLIKIFEEISKINLETIESPSRATNPYMYGILVKKLTPKETEVVRGIFTHITMHPKAAEELTEELAAILSVKKRAITSIRAWLKRNKSLPTASKHETEVQYYNWEAGLKFKKRR